MFFSSRATAPRFTRKTLGAAAALLIALCLSASPALAGTLTSETGVCPGQIFSQPFAALGDQNAYTLVAGSEFNNPPEGWELKGGASVVSATHPDGSAGYALDLPSGSVAVSAPVCVTLQYPSARLYSKTLDGKGGVAIAVSYAETKTEIKPKQVGETKNTQGAWQASEAFNVLPQIAGKAEETREVRFVLTAGSNSTSTLVYGLYVDPWMK
jgi:hypothetical protein